MQTGDRCPKCGTGRVRIVGTRVDGDDRVRYFGCNDCQFRTTQIVPLTHAPKQQTCGRPRSI